MKRSTLRIACAFLLMTVTLICSLGLMSAAADSNPMTDPASGSANTAQTEEETAIWVRMVMLSEAQEIRLCRPDGAVLQLLTPNENGQAATDLLEPGEYLAVTELGRVSFRLNKNASISVLSGDGWSDGERLHLTGPDVGTLTLRRQISANTLKKGNGWLDYVLSGSQEHRQVLHFDSEGQYSLYFQGLTYGSYNLYENGIFRARIIISAAASEVTLELSDDSALATNRAPSAG